MRWFIGFLVVFVFIVKLFSTKKYSAKFIMGVRANAPEKIKVLLQEEFPQHKHLITTSLCSVFMSEYFNFARSKTSEKNDANALVKFEKLIQKERRKGLNILDNELIDLAISKMPIELQKTLEHSDARNRFDRAIDLGARQAVVSGAG